MPLNGRLYVSLLGFVAMASAWGQTMPRTPAEYLARMDEDGDGRVSEAEYVRYMSQGFRRMDVNGDGVLDANDGPMRPGALPVTLASFERNLVIAFHKLDRNGDGYLDAHELAQPPR